MVKIKSKLRTFWWREVQTQKSTLTIIYIPFENLLAKEWSGIYILLQFSWGHNQTQKVASKMHKYTHVQVTENYQGQQLLSPLTGKNI